jgi:HEAT repeat protein
LMGGRGLSANLNRMKMRHGKLITLPDEIDADGLLAMLENPKHQNLDTIGESPTVLNMDQMGEEQARRLQQIVRSGSPESRLIAVRTLAQMRRLKYVPSLMYALSDPDRRVVREARDGLRFISRRIGGFGLPDNFTERQRYDTIDKWKQWYQKILTDDL